MEKIGSFFKLTSNASACLKKEDIRSTGCRPSIWTHSRNPRRWISSATHCAIRPSPTINQRMFLCSLSISAAARIAGKS
ncbi:hypothetical protein D3C71_1876340 [compost metagenome]